MTKISITWVVALVICGTACMVPAAEPTKDSLATVKQNINAKQAVLVDVREKSEWEQGHIAGAIFLPLSVLGGQIGPDKLTALPKDKIVYTHCVVGKRSLNAANVLEKHGYQVRSLNAGYKELLRAGFEKAQP